MAADLAFQWRADRAAFSDSPLAYAVCPHHAKKGLESPGATLSNELPSLYKAVFKENLIML
ncbi:hypothetical protein FALCPG4_002303 [Fusarium falciforme]|jgi:hypothetical protein